MRIKTEDQAVDRYIDLVEKSAEESGGSPMYPSRGATTETDAGWAIFTVQGYMGTVTENGDVIEEQEFADTVAQNLRFQV